MTTSVTPIVEIRHAWGFMVWEPEDGIVTRAPITLVEGYGLVLAGTVLGEVSGGVAVAGVNTGNGVFGGIAELPGAQDGAYVATCVQGTTGAPAATVVPHEGNVGTGVLGTVTVTAPAVLGAFKVELTATGATAAFDVFTPGGALVGSGSVGALFTGGGLSFTLANAGTMTKGDSWDVIVTDDGVALFSLVDPNGAALPTVTVGAAYNHELGFTLSQGATKFVVGDSFTITVTAASGQYAPYDPTATNGLQFAKAILGSYRKDTTSANQPAGALVRGPARVNAGELVWGANVTTTPQKTIALEQLSAQGIQAT